MFRTPWRSSRWGGILAIVLSIPLLAIGLVFWRASHAKEEATAEVPLQVGIFVSRSPRRSRSAGSRAACSVSPGFRDLATAYKDTIVVSARAGLFVYNRSGVLIRSYRVGLELPPAELGSVFVGIAAGSAEQELFIATRGEGLLAFNGERFRQVLPADSGLRIVSAVLVMGSGRVLLSCGTPGAAGIRWPASHAFSCSSRSTHITALAGSDGDLWIGTLDNGVFHYRAGQLEELLSALPDLAGSFARCREERGLLRRTPLGVVEFRDGQRRRALADGFFSRALARARRSAPCRHRG